MAFNLPGNIYSGTKGSFCETHEDRPSYKKLQGETDSFGAEYSEMCEECFAVYEKSLEVKVAKEEPCDWCKVVTNTIEPTRDYSEGSNGPVYYVCQACRIKQDNEARDELNELHQWDDE